MKSPALTPLFSCQILPIIKKHYPLFALAFAGLMLDACRQPEASQVFDETTWADHSVSLESNSNHYKVVIETQSPVNKVDSQTPWQIYAISEKEGLQGRKWGLYYVDYSNHESKDLSSYTYGIHVTKIAANTNQVDVSLMLFRDTPSWENAPKHPTSSPREIYLGRARFENNQSLTTIDFGMKSPIISTLRSTGDFIGNGQLAIHYLNNVDYAAPSPVEDCRSDIENCASISLASACQGNILATDCVPANSLFNLGDAFDAVATVENLKPLATGRFLLDQKTMHQDTVTVVTITSSSIAATEDDNSVKCMELVSYIRSSAIDNTENNACRILQEPSASPVDGKLSCRISVKFDSPQDVSEYACNITAVMMGDQKEFHTVQVLYQPLSQ